MGFNILSDILTVDEQIFFLKKHRKWPGYGIKLVIKSMYSKLREEKWNIYQVYLSHRITNSGHFIQRPFHTQETISYTTQTQESFGTRILCTSW